MSGWGRNLFAGWRVLCHCSGLCRPRGTYTTLACRSGEWQGNSGRGGGGEENSVVKVWVGMLLALALNAGVWAEPVDFSLQDTQGKQRSLSEFRGKWVVLNYWATWCPPCLEEIPDLVLFHERHKTRMPW